MFTPPPLRPHRLAVCLALIAVLTSSSSRLAAAPLGTCVPSEHIYTNTTAVRPFVVTVDYAAAVALDMSVQALRDSAIHAASTLNEFGGSGPFVYIGPGTTDDVPSSCAYSVIAVVHEENSAAALAIPRCGGSRFRVRMFSHDSDGFPRLKGNGATSTRVDAAGVFMHELIHTYGVDHPDEDDDSAENAMIDQRGTSQGGTRLLREYDIKCISELGGPRQLTPLKRSVNSGVFGSEVAYASEAAGMVVSSLSDVAGTWYFVGIESFSPSTSYLWDTSLNDSHATIGSTHADPIGLAPWSIRELPNQDAISYIDRVDQGGMTNVLAAHQTRIVHTSDNWATTQNEPLRACQAMSSWTACSGAPVDVAALGAIGTGYLADIDTSVFAWAHYDPVQGGSLPSNHEIRISVGRATSTGSTVLAQPVLTGYRTKTPPAIACMENAIGGRDCLLVYVPEESISNTIVARRFSVTPGTNRYISVLDALGAGLPGSTGNRAAAWYNTGTQTVSVAYRSLGEYQLLNVHTSLDGISWTVTYPNFTISPIPPSLASTWRGANNVMTYAN